MTANPTWHLIIDVAECNHCHNCVLAAKDELVGNDFPGYSAPHAAHGPGVIRIERTVRGHGHWVDAAHLPRLCQHCANAPCVAAGQGAVRQRPDGIVIFDPVAAKGRRDLVDACPHGAVVWNEAAQLPQTWFFDAHLLDQGQAAPRCVAVCPTQAIQALKVSDADMAQRAQAEGLRRLQPEHGTQGRVFYRHLHRVDRLRLAGSAIANVQGRPECLEGAEVRLVRDGQVLAQTRSNAFGDFAFDDLPPGAGRLSVHLSHPQAGQAVVATALAQTPVVLGDVLLS
ncbi:4Fe-4S dicluster domain-containing protein [Ideonella livida]|uniref:Oxidoreductase n=1 Tax=Ideonella livida TaxID=2707176 RepID=A0A7C9TLH5_9BURK|nr:4Fe-4S dicluster domain-containing protein [Ideonella livida]NDY93519.1 oxidoreductase [Ideonella livida]